MSYYLGCKVATRVSPLLNFVSFNIPINFFFYINFTFAFGFIHSCHRSSCMQIGCPCNWHKWRLQMRRNEWRAFIDALIIECNWYYRYLRFSCPLTFLLFKTRPLSKHQLQYKIYWVSTIYCFRNTYINVLTTTKQFYRILKSNLQAFLLTCQEN